MQEYTKNFIEYLKTLYEDMNSTFTDEELERIAAYKKEQYDYVNDPDNYDVPAIDKMNDLVSYNVLSCIELMARDMGFLLNIYAERIDGNPLTAYAAENEVITDILASIAEPFTKILPDGAGLMTRTASDKNNSVVEVTVAIKKENE